MNNNNLILRILNSPWITPVLDVTTENKLSHTNADYPLYKSLDNNFIYLKGEVIKSAEFSGNELILKKINDVDFKVDLSPLVSGLENRVGSLEKAEDADTFTESSSLSEKIITFTRNDEETYSVDLSPLVSGLENRVGSLEKAEDADTFTESSSLSEKIITFTRNDEETYSVDLSPLVSDLKDVYVNSGNLDVENKKLTFTNTDGVGFDVTNAAALFTDNDIYVVSGTYNPETGVVTYTTNVDSTFQVSGFAKELTDSYTTTVTLNDTTLNFDNTSKGENFYSVDLSPLLKELSGRVGDLENTEDADTYTTSATMIGDTLTFIRNDEKTYGVDLSSLTNEDTDWKINGNNMYSLPSGNVGIGTNSPSERLHVSGNIIADSISSNGPNNVRILNPEGGEYSSGTKKGYIVITLPQGWTNTMLSMTVKIFDYSEHEHATLNLAGYTYGGSITSGAIAQWTATSAWVEGNPIDEHNFKVRFGYDNAKDKCVIVIGNVDTTWSIPKVYVTDLQVAANNYQSSKWNDGWDIIISETVDISAARTSDAGIWVDDIHHSTQAHNWIRNTDNSIKYQSGNVKILGSNSLTINDYTLPTSDGIDGQVLKTDGDGNVTWENDDDINTDIYTTSASLSDNILTFIRNDKQTYNVNLSSLNSEDTDWKINGNNMYSLPSGNVGIGTASPSEKLHVAGNVRGDSFSTYSSTNGNTHTRILHPNGGSYSESGSVTGSIGIDLPQGYTNTMLNFKVKVFDYTENEHITINIAGYTYDGGSTASPKWHRTTAWVEGSPKDEHNLKVRFGYDKRYDKCTIFIGEETSTWSYPKVYVTDVHVGNSSSTPDKWNDGWYVWFINNWSTLQIPNGGGIRYKIDKIQQNTQVNNWVRNTDNSIEYKNGNAKILGGNSLTINDYTLPASDGADGQVLKTDGSGVVTWQNDIDTNTSIWSENTSYKRNSDNTNISGAYYNSGYIGIGNSTPQSKLHIEGPNYGDSSIRFLNDANGNDDYWMIGSRSFSGDKDGFEIGRNFGSATGGDSTGGKLYITNSGNVSIGNGYQPTEKLEVAGSILADGGLLKVENNSRTFSVGPLNTSWTHFNTNSNNGFYFYRPISIKENIDGEVFKSENNYITVSHDGSKLEIQNKKTTNHHPGLLIKDKNGNVTFQAVTEVNNTSGVGVRSKVESNKGDLWLASESNTIEMIPNSSEGPSGTAWNRRSTFESNGSFTLRGTIKIEGGSPGSGKVLTSDGSGNASWQTPSSSNDSSSSNQFAGVGTPVGSVIMWSTVGAPTGWLICDGSYVKKEDYEELYDVIGSTYGQLRNSNGYLEFKLPNLQSRIPAGYNSSDSNFNSIGKTGGASTHTLTENQIPHKKHRHEIGYGEDASGNPISDESSEHFHAISWVRDNSGEGDTLTNDQAKSVIDLFNSRKLNANGNADNWRVKLINNLVGTTNQFGEYSESNDASGTFVYNPISDWDPSNANWVYTGIHKYGPTDNTNGVSNLQAIQQGRVIPDGAHGHSSEFMSTGQATSNAGGSTHNNLQPYIVMNYIICANAVESTSSPSEPVEQPSWNG